VAHVLERWDRRVIMAAPRLEQAQRSCPTGHGLPVTRGLERLSCPLDQPRRRPSRDAGEDGVACARHRHLRAHTRRAVRETSADEGLRTLVRGGRASRSRSPGSGRPLLGAPLPTSGVGTSSTLVPKRVPMGRRGSWALRRHIRRVSPCLSFLSYRWELRATPPALGRAAVRPSHYASKPSCQCT
jgi:hypothetical protein